jgi:hypothetical protein
MQLHTGETDQPMMLRMVRRRVGLQFGLLADLSTGNEY